MQKRHVTPALLALAAFVAACSSTPTSTSLLEQSRSAFAAAQSNPRVQTYAPLEFKQAADALEQANAAARRREDASEVDKLAYLARQKIATAQEVATRKAAEAEIASAAQQREQLRLAQRTQEAEQAKMAAQAAQSQAQAAEARAAQLAAQLADLSAKKTERGMVVTLGDVLFGSGQSSLTPEGMRSVRKLADVLTNNPQRRVLIEGFTDSTGSAARNLELSQRRAEAVRNALMEMGIAGDRIAVRPYGEAYPVAGNDRATDRRLNRRVEIVLSEDGAAIPPRF